MGILQVVVDGVDSVKLTEVDAPQATSDDVIVKVEQCGICGSDLGYISMGGLLGPGVPMRLGHELSGTVVEAGSNVSHVAVGDRVIVNPVANSNQIGNGGPEGGFTPLLHVRGAAQDEQGVIKLPDTLDFEQGALVEPLAVSMHAVHKASLTAQDRVVVFGAGPIGLGIVLVARYYGVDDIVVVDLSEQRLKTASQLGAAPFKASEGDLPQFLSERWGSRDVMGMPMPAADAFFEATGAGPVFNQIVNMAPVNARVVVVGVHKAPVEFDLVNLLLRELQVSGSMAYPDEFSQVIEMLACGKVDPSPLVSHRYDLSEFPDALAMARDQAQALKVLVACQR